MEIGLDRADFAEFFFHTREQARDWRGAGVREVQRAVEGDCSEGLAPSSRVRRAILGVETRVIPSAAVYLPRRGRLLGANGHTTGKSASGRFRIRGLRAALIQRMCFCASR
jgi:hypothetical protein